MYHRPMEFFNVEHTDGQARAGVLKTAHSTIQTPVFMPVGTRGSVKSLSQHDLDELGPEIILGNTYHLYLRPGHELIEKVGDRHGRERKTLCRPISAMRNDLAIEEVELHLDAAIAIGNR